MGPPSPEVLHVGGKPPWLLGELLGQTERLEKSISTDEECTGAAVDVCPSVCCCTMLPSPSQVNTQPHPCHSLAVDLGPPIPGKRPDLGMQE